MSRRQRSEATPSVTVVTDPRPERFQYIADNTEHLGEVHDDRTYDVREMDGTMTQATGHAIRKMNGYWVCLNLEVTRVRFVKLELALDDPLNQERPNTLVRQGKRDREGVYES